MTIPATEISLVGVILRINTMSMSYTSLGVLLSANGNEMWLSILDIGPRTGGHFIQLYTEDAVDQFNSSSNPSFTSEMEDDGLITFTLVATGETVEISLSPFNRTGSYYRLVPSNKPEIKDFYILVLAQDAADRAITLTFDDLQNFPPVVTATTSIDVINAGQAIMLTGTATDPDAVPDTLALQWTANPDIGIFSDDDILSPTWTAPSTPTDNDRQVVLTLTATEPDLSLTGSASVTIAIRGNVAPAVTATANPMTVDVGDTVTLTGTANDPEGQSMTYLWESDAGGTFGNSSALSTTWVAPNVTESTLVSLTLTANDGGRTGMATADVIVRPPATMPLALAAIADKTGVTGTVVNVQLPEATEGLAPYIYAASGLPAGLGLTGRRVRGLPIMPGTYAVTYSVSDSNQDSVSRDFDWVITGDLIPQPAGRNLRIDWGNQFFASPHADVTARIRTALMFERGKNTASAILGRSQAGILRCELRNFDGLFDEENPDSALAGQVRPGITVQLRDGITPLWTGVLDSIPTEFELNGEHRSIVTAYGVFSTAIEADVGGGALTPESTYQAFNELAGKAQIGVESLDSDASPYLMARWWERGSLRQSLRDIEDTEGGLIYEAKNGNLAFQDGGYRARQTYDTKFVSSTPGSGEIRIVGNPKREIAVKDVHNEVVGLLQTFQTLDSQVLIQFQDAIPIALGGRLDLMTQYPIDRNGVSALDTLVSGTDWAANTAADGSGSNRTSQVSITPVLDDFNEIDVTIAYPVITGQTQATTVYVRGLQIKGTLISSATPLLVIKRDTVSLDRYRLKTLRLDGTWIRSALDMGARAQKILDALSSPEKRIYFDWYVHTWADFNALELSDRIRIELPTIASDAFIEAIRLMIPLSQVNPVCTLDVSLVSGDMPSPSGPSTIPAQPGRVSLTAPTSTTIRVTLSSDPDDGGESITDRDIRHRETGTSSWTRIDSISSPYTITSLTADTEYEVQWRAGNSIGNGPWSDSREITTLGALFAPAFADGTGNAQTWTQDSAIANITVPAATGSPSPTYAAIGALPTGISFNTGSRVISGTPTATGSGTIRIRATNSQGSDDWTVAYTTNADAGGSSVTVPLTGISVFDNYIRWSDNQDIGSVFDLNDQAQVITFVDLNNANPVGRVAISIVGTNNRFTAAFEATGRIIFEASDGEMLEVTIGDADTSEPYQWTPTNGAEVVAFVLHIKTLVDQDATLTLSD